MVRSHSTRVACGAAVALALFATPSASLAQAPTVDCSTLPQVIYGMGGSAQKPLVRDIAIALANATPPQTLTYNSTQGACSGINSIVDGRGVIPATTTYWNAAGQEGTCNVATPVTQLADFGLMGNQATLCSGIEESELYNIRDVHGPVGSVNILVPNGSSELAITSEALHFIYRYGPNSGVAPWTSPSTEDFIRRNNSSFVKLFVSIAAGLPTTFTFLGTDAGTNENTVTLLNARAQLNPNLPIGFASGDVADENRGTIRTLAYQHTGQEHAYWPDSNFDTFDKRNVRNGQYYLWAPAHFYARYNPGNGQYESEAAARLLGYISDTVPAPTGVNLLDIFIDASNVPLCAMEVGRAYDLGPIYSYQPDEPCGCYFDDRVSGSTTCTACTGDEGTAGTCPGTGGANVCRHGFCEVQ